MAEGISKFLLQFRPTSVQIAAHHFDGLLDSLGEIVWKGIDYIFGCWVSSGIQ